MEVCRKMQGDRIISALIGLVGAVSNNGKTERTDSVVREAFLRLTDGDSEETVQKIHAEKIRHCTGLRAVSTPVAILQITIWRNFTQQMQGSIMTETGLINS